MEIDKKVVASNEKCDNCGSNLIFEPSKKALFCNSCGSVFPFKIINGSFKKDIKFFDEKSHEIWHKQNKIIHCDTCGANISLNGLEITTNCPYCSSTYVVEKEVLPGVKPDAIIPFKFNKKEAKEIFRKNVKKKFFAPSKLKKDFPDGKMIGIYVPTFAFDANTSSSYDGVLEERVTYTDRKGNTRTKIRRFHISGHKDCTHRDVQIESSSKLDSRQFRVLLPYNLNESCLFDENFLRGFSVEHYEDSLKECYQCAHICFDEEIKRKILRSYSYDDVVYLNVDTDYYNELYTYRLLPIYLIEYTFNKKNYVAMMNAQTGKIGHGIPLSPVKITLCVLSIIIIIVVLLLILLS